MKGFRKKECYIDKKQLAEFSLCISIALAAILFLSCQFQKSFEHTSQENQQVNVVVEYERHEDLPGVYKIDAVIPKIEDSGETIEKFNEIIQEEFAEFYELNAGNATEILGGWQYPQIDISYHVTHIEQICAINIITQISSEKDLGKEASVRSYYYDETTKKILTPQQYLEKIGLSPNDVAQAFLQGEGRNYNLEHVAFSSLLNHFYINEEKNPVFFVAD